MHFNIIEMSGTEISQRLSTLTNHGLLDSLGWALIHSLWQGCLAALFVFGFRTLFKHVKPALRYAVQISALFAVFFAFISTVILYQTHAMPSTASSTKLAFSIPLPTQISLPVLEAASLTGVSSTAVENFQIVGELGQMTPVISLLWCLGFFYLMLRYIAAYILTQRLRKTGLSPVPSDWTDRFNTLLLNTGVSQRVDLFISAHIQGPMTLGFFKPVVLVPVSFFTRLTQDQIEAVLLHEIAHIHRHDYIINLLQMMIKSIFFFHPAVHYISRQIDEDREQACDDISVAQTRDPKTLARGLATLRLMQNQAQPRIALSSNLSHRHASNDTSSALVMRATGTQDSALVMRLKRLVGDESRTRKPEHVLLSALTIFLIGGLGLSAAPLQATATEPKAQPRPLIESLDIIWPNEAIDDQTKATVKWVRHDPFNAPTPPSPPSPPALGSFPEAPQAPTPPAASVPSVPQIPQTPRLGLQSSSPQFDSEVLAGAPLTESPDTRFLNDRIQVDITRAQNFEPAQTERQIEAVAERAERRIEAEVKRQVQQAERQIKQAERQIEMAQRQIERAERLAEKKVRNAEIRAQKSERARDKAERVRIKNKEKIRKNKNKNKDKTYSKFKETLTQSLLSDGLIRSKTDPYSVTFSNGRAVINGTPVPNNLIDKYCSILNRYGLHKNSKLKITSQPKRFMFTSQSKDGQSNQTVTIGSFSKSKSSHNHDPRPVTTITHHTHSDIHSNVHSDIHTKAHSNSHPTQHKIEFQSDAKGLTFVKPVSTTRITASFGQASPKVQFHTGIDLAVPKFTPVKASANGVVHSITSDSSWGNRIILKHKNGYKTIYANLNDMQVSKGDHIKTGTQIGTVGTSASSGVSGRPTHPHLHFEILKDGQLKNPKTLIMSF